MYTVRRLNIEESLHQKMVVRKPGVEGEPVVVSDDFRTLSGLLLEKSFAGTKEIGDALKDTTYFDLGKRVSSKGNFEEWTLAGSPAAQGDPLQLKKDQKLAEMLLEKTG